MAWEQICNERDTSSILLAGIVCTALLFIVLMFGAPSRPRHATATVFAAFALIAQIVGPGLVPKSDYHR
jgi:hypothetical protein